MALVLGGNEYVSLFTLSAPTDIRVEAAGRGSGDPIIDLLDSTGGMILSDDDSGGNAASRAETSLDAGTYCMSLRSYDGGPMTAFVRIGRQEQEALTEGVSAPTAAPPQAAATQLCPSDHSGTVFRPPSMIHRSGASNLMVRPRSRSQRKTNTADPVHHSLWSGRGLY